LNKKFGVHLIWRWMEKKIWRAFNLAMDEKKKFGYHLTWKNIVRIR